MFEAFSPATRTLTVVVAALSTQGSAADIMKVAMIAIARAIAEEKLEAKMLLTVHDELVFEAPPDEKAALEALVRHHMEHAVELKVPMVVDAGWGKHWGEAH